MTNNNNLSSKILIFETNELVVESLKAFFHKNQLSGLKQTNLNSLEVLSSSTDIGAVFIGHDVMINGRAGINAVKLINQKRPELPIFYRQADGLDVSELQPHIQSIVSACYQIDNLQKLKKIIDDKLYSTYFPMPMVRGIQELSLQAINATIKNCIINCETPYMIRDDLIYGEIFSLIPLESDWCRGFMMLQSTQEETINLISLNKTALSNQLVTFSDVNELFNEITNLIWGNIRAEYFISNQESALNNVQTQVPIVVDHSNKYISFGSNNPQLCFQYNVQDEKTGGVNFTIFQKLVFNLSWNPELFKESDKTLDHLINKGELEFF